MLGKCKTKVSRCRISAAVTALSFLSREERPWSQGTAGEGEPSRGLEQRDARGRAGQGQQHVPSGTDSGAEERSDFL